MNTRQLSELEQTAMTIVWELQSCSVRDVLEKINKKKQLAYTTVATILQRLHEKGLVIRKREGIAFIYSAKLSKETYSKNLAQLFISKFFNSFGNVGLASFAESIDKLPKKKKEYLFELLEAYDKTK
ncbi:BlaI/MecI/CopY family transcriptional regulator [Candidatus Gottesmanbacteria bacterium]|nr:BlaI/MecI/CopY family transcriptional regulator [Candidatus Gottesmanbacteria bacterium]